MEMVEDITRVPNAPPFVDGVVFSRGQVVPVVNLRARFGFERASLRSAHPPDRRPVGGRGSSAWSSTRRASSSTSRPTPIQPPHEALAGLSGRYVEGIASLGDRLILVLDLSRILNFAESADRRTRSATHGERARYGNAHEENRTAGRTDAQRRRPVASTLTWCTERAGQVTTAAHGIARIADAVFEGAEVQTPVARRSGHRRQPDGDVADADGDAGRVGRRLDRRARLVGQRAGGLDRAGLGEHDEPGGARSPKPPPPRRRRPRRFRR